MIVLAAASFAASDLAVSVSLGTTLFGFNTLITATFNTMLGTVVSSVTDVSLNVKAKIEDCEKTNFALYDAIWKQVNTDVAVCLKSYATDDKYVIGNWTLLFKLILSEALTATNNITLCIKSNALTDAKSIIAANNCTVGALITCFDLVSLTYPENWKN